MGISWAMLAQKNIFNRVSQIDPRSPNTSLWNWSAKGQGGEGHPPNLQLLRSFIVKNLVCKFLSLKGRRGLPHFSKVVWRRWMKQEFCPNLYSTSPNSPGSLGRSRYPRSSGRWGSPGSWAASLPASASHGAPAGGSRPPEQEGAATHTSHKIDPEFM